MPHATLPPPGLQALILCGPGVNLNTFTSTPGDFPKALVPIANRPMVWYPLDWCYRMGVTDITLVTPPESAAPLEAALATNPALTGLPNPRPEILAPAELTPTTGTGELLRLPEVQKCILNDFIVLPCDLISELDGTKIVQQWITLNPLPSSTGRKGGLSVFYPTFGLDGISSKKDETDFLATVPLPGSAVPPPAGSIRSHVEEVVLNMPTDTLKDKLEEDQGFLRLRQRLLERHGRVKLRMRHRDANVYVFPHWVKDFAARNERFDSISEDLLGWWARAGWQDGLKEKLQLNQVLGETGKSEHDADDGEEEPVIDVAELSSTKFSKSTRPHHQPFASRVSTRTSPRPSTTSCPLPPLLAYVHPAATPTSHAALLRRVDTSAQLLSISLHLAKHAAGAGSPLSHELKVHPTATLEQQARVSEADSLIGENVRLGFRSNVKESVIGANCDIGRNVRLTKCLLMEGVVVGDGVTMVGCIVGRRAKIEGKAARTDPVNDAADEPSKRGKKAAAADDDDEKTNLIDCEIAPYFVVDAGTEAKDHKFMGFDTEEDETEE